MKYVSIFFLVLGALFLVTWNIALAGLSLVAAGIWWEVAEGRLTRHLFKDAEDYANKKGKDR